MAGPWKRILLSRHGEIFMAHQTRRRAPASRHTHIRATAQPFRWNSTRTSTWNLLTASVRSYLGRTQTPAHLFTLSCTGDCTSLVISCPYFAHNRGTRANILGVKPCCLAPVFPTESWLMAVASEGPVPCNYSRKAWLCAAKSPGKPG